MNHATPAASKRRTPTPAEMSAAPTGAGTESLPSAADPSPGAQLAVTHATRQQLPVGNGDHLAALVTIGQDEPPRGTVLLVPGFTGSKEDFAPVLDPLAANGFRAIAVDLPGQYESAGSGGEDAFFPEPLGQALAGLIAGLAEPPVLLGHSYGGLVARSAVISGARVAGLILLCSGPAELPAGHGRDATALGLRLIREHGLAAAQRLREERTAMAQQPPAELVAFYRERFLASSPASLAGMAAALLSEPDRVDELGSALRADATPVAVVAGEADEAWGLQAQAEMARRLGSRLSLIPGAGHSPAVENPEALLSLLLALLRHWLR